MEGRITDFLLSSSEDKNSSWAVLNESVRESAVVARDVSRSPKFGLNARGRLVGCGGVTSGVGGLRWFGGVTGGRVSAFWGVCTLASTIVGLEGRPDELLDDFRECLGGVGGKSGPLPILFDWCFKVLGLDG